MWGTFCYKVMPFGLKNAGETYQRAMVAVFHDMIHHEIEVYVDDMIARSQTEEEHLLKFALPYSSRHVKNNLQVAQVRSRVGQSNHLLRKSSQN